MIKNLDLFITFSKVGAFTFGGGYSMLPILKKEVVENKKWISENEMLDYYALSQCMPGIISINTSIFIGFKCNGILGGIFSALGAVAPSILLILAICLFMQNFMDYEVVQTAFKGIRIVVSALILNATYSLFKIGVIDMTTLGIFVASLFILFLFDISPILIVLIATTIGVVLSR